MSNAQHTPDSRPHNVADLTPGAFLAALHALRGRHEASAFDDQTVAYHIELGALDIYASALVRGALVDGLSWRSLADFLYASIGATDFGRPVDFPEQLAAYVVGVIADRHETARFVDESEADSALSCALNWIDDEEGGSYLRAHQTVAKGRVLSNHADAEPYVGVEHEGTPLLHSLCDAWKDSVANLVTVFSELEGRAPAFVESLRQFVAESTPRKVVA